MRLTFAVFIAASVAFGSACSSSSATSTATDGAAAVVDVVVVNGCLSYGPTGSVCKGGGLCGLGFTSQGQYLCASSTEVCCIPVGDGSGDSGGGGVPDATIADATVHDAGHAPHDAGTDAVHETGTPDVVTVVDSGHDAGHEAAVDSGHDAGHDAGEDAGHDAGHDAAVDAPAKTNDAGNDAEHHEAGTDAKPG